MSTTVHPKAPARGTITVPVTLDPETRSATGELKLSGLAAPYERKSLDIGFTEVIARDAFATSIASDDIFLLWQHDSAQPLARKSAGNLEVRNTPEGVRFTATLPNTTLARDAVELVRSGTIDELSFGFVVERDGWEVRDGEKVRVVKRGKLLELSLVSRAAYGKETNVANRGRGGSKAELQARIERTVAHHRLNRPRVTASPYTPDGPYSYYRDLLSTGLEASYREAAVRAGAELMGPIGDPGFLRNNLHGGIPEARARLNQLHRHLVETRDLTTTATDGGGFIPTAPVHIADAFAASVRNRGTLPFVLPVKPLPEKGMTVATPRITTGLDTEVNTTENVAPSTADLVESRTDIPVSMIRGYEDVSTQLLDRAEPGIDEVIAVELGRSLAEQLDLLLFTGSGSGKYLLGLDSVSGITTTSYTDASPTQAEAWAKLVENAAAVATALGDEPDLLLLHPRRHAWLFGSIWSATTPVLPYGMRAVPCPTITTTAGGSTNEDRAYTLASSELPVLLAPPVFEVMIQTDGLSDALTVRCIARQYASALFGRRPEAIGVVSGTGLATPSTY